MTIHFQYETNPIGIYVTCAGIVTGEEIVTANEDVSKCVNCHYQLLDFTEAKKINISIEEMHKISIQDSFITESYRLEKIALVGEAKFLKQILETYEFFSKVWVGRRKPYITKLFQTMSEARIWVSS